MSTPPVPPPPPASDAQPRSNGARRWADQHGPLLAIVAAVLLATTLACATFWAVNYRTAETLNDRAQTRADERDAARADLDAAQSQVSALETKVGGLEGKVNTLEAAADGVADRAAELETREAELAEREQAVTKTEDRIAETTITEGTWTVGVDIEPGTYRTTEPVAAGASCYWGIYRSGSNGDDIIQNDIVTGGRPTVTLSDGQDFTTQRCGSWAKQ